MMEETYDTTINIFTKGFEIFGYMLYVVADYESLPYIEQYIETVRQGNPDKEIVIKRYMEEIYVIMNKNPNIPLGSNSRFFIYLDKIERDLSPILEAIKRDKKIDDLLG